MAEIEGDSGGNSGAGVDAKGVRSGGLLGSAGSAPGSGAKPALPLSQEPGAAIELWNPPLEAGGAGRWEADGGLSNSSNEAGGWYSSDDEGEEGSDWTGDKSILTDEGDS